MRKSTSLATLLTTVMLAAMTLPARAGIHDVNVDEFAIIVATSAYAEADCPGVKADHASLDAYRRAADVKGADMPRVEASAAALGLVFDKRIKEITPAVWCKEVFAVVGRGGSSEFPFLVMKARH